MELPINKNVIKLCQFLSLTSCFVSYNIEDTIGRLGEMEKSANGKFINR